MLDNMFHEQHGDNDLFSQASEENPDLFKISEKLSRGETDLEYITVKKTAEHIAEKIDSTVIDRALGKAVQNNTKYGKVSVQRKISKEIDHCWNCCPYFESHPGDPMECAHPYFADKGAYAGVALGSLFYAQQKHLFRTKHEKCKRSYN